MAVDTSFHAMCIGAQWLTQWISAIGIVIKYINYIRAPYMNPRTTPIVQDGQL